MTTLCGHKPSTMKKSKGSAIQEDFNLNSIPEVYFWKSEWEDFDPHDHYTPISSFYLTYRFVYMVYFVAATIENIVCDDGYLDFYFTFLTNQSFTIQLIYSIAAFSFVLSIFIRQKQQRTSWIQQSHSSFHNENYKLPVSCKFLWIMINLVQVIPYVVTLIYWIFLFDENAYGSLCGTIDNTLVHAFNSVMALLDSFVIAVPIRRSHVLFPAIFGLAYSVFSGLYELFGGQYAGDRNYIYPILDWKSKPGFATITCIGGIISAFVIHISLSWGVYRLRTYIRGKCTQDVFIDEHERLLELK